jgi:hypothetical protein
MIDLADERHHVRRGHDGEGDRDGVADEEVCLDVVEVEEHRDRALSPASCENLFSPRNLQIDAPHPHLAHHENLVQHFASSSSKFQFPPNFEFRYSNRRNLEIETLW